MKAVLFALNSSYVHTNLAIRCLKNSVEDKAHNKHEIVLVEKNLKDKKDEVLYNLCRQNADVYGFSCYIFNIKEMLYYAKNLKKLIPEVKIVFGGPEVSYDTEIFLKSNLYIDYVITQEAESAFIDFLDGVHNTKVINGKTYRDFADQGIQYSVDDDFTGNIAYYESSRGCPFRCSYCLSTNFTSVRSKTPDKTLDDLLEFEKFKKISIIKFVDRTFNYDIKRANEIFKGLLDEKYTKIYHMEIRPELFDDEMFEILKKYPKNKLQMEIGIQSTNFMAL